MPKEESALSCKFSDPLEFLLAMMNDQSLSAADRIEAANALLPYFHESLNPIEDDQDD